jgi:hypothetical protein
MLVFFKTKNTKKKKKFKNQNREQNGHEAKVQNKRNE